MILGTDRRAGVSNRASVLLSSTLLAAASTLQLLTFTACASRGPTAVVSALAPGPPTRERRSEEAEEWQRALAAAASPQRDLVRAAVSAYYRGEEAQARRLMARAERAGAEVPRQLLALLDGAASRRIAAAEAGQPEVTVGEAVRVDLGGGSAQAAEPILLAGPGSGGDALTVAWIDSRREDAGGNWRIGLASSEDGGETWTENLLEPQPPLVSAYHGDPMAVLDPRSGRRWVGAVSFAPSNSGSGVWAARARPGAVIDEPATVFSGHADKSLLAAGPAPGDPASTRLYATFDRGVSVSVDGGATWSAPVAAPDLNLGLQPRVGPGGELYVSYVEQPDRIHLMRSLDGGASFEAPDLVATRLDSWSPADSSRTPGTFRVAPITEMAVDPVRGTLYCVWSDTARLVAGDADLDLFLARSDDGGRTWSVPATVLGGDGDQFFPWIEVDPRGWVHLVFFDTRQGAQRDDAPSALVDAYYALSTDGGASWQEHRLTAAPFDTAGAVWGPEFQGAQFLGDYLGLAVSGNRVYVAYPAASAAGDLDLLVQTVELAVPCPEDEALCLGGGRFQVEATWRTSVGTQGRGQPVPLTADSGFFWFFRDTNLELVVKVLNGCPVNGHYWVFAGGLTNVDVILTVRDLESGAEVRYDSPLDTPFQPITATTALAVCP